MSTATCCASKGTIRCTSLLWRMCLLTIGQGQACHLLQKAESIECCQVPEHHQAGAC
jgi:hypothetical protein